MQPWLLPYAVHQLPSGLLVASLPGQPPVTLPPSALCGVPVYFAGGNHPFAKQVADIVAAMAGQMTAAMDKAEPGGDWSAVAAVPVMPPPMLCGLPIHFTDKLPNLGVPPVVLAPLSSDARAVDEMVTEARLPPEIDTNRRELAAALVEAGADFERGLGETAAGRWAAGMASVV